MEKKTRGRPKKEKPQVAIDDESIVDIAQEVATNDEKELYVYGVCKNPKWLLCSDENRNKCYVEVPVKIATMLVGKTIKAVKIDGSDENHYKLLNE